MITGAQVRAARGLLGLSQEELAERSAISQSTIKRFESGRSDQMRDGSIQRIQRTLETAGIDFLDHVGGQGVLLRRNGAHA